MWSQPLDHQGSPTKSFSTFLSLDPHKNLVRPLPDRQNTIDVVECMASGAKQSAFESVFITSQLSLVAQTVNHLSTMRETWVRSLGREDPLEKEMAIHSSTIAWKIRWTEEPGRLQSMGSQRVGHD